jgi:1-pyrroline-5-carboxylate dehydrogenase
MSAPSNGIRRLGPAINEPICQYAPGSPERAELKARLAAMEKEQPEVPLVIGGKEVRTGDIAKAVSPHKHAHVTATWHKARKEDVTAAINAALGAQREWASWRWEDRAAVILRAADLLATTWRSTLAAATMLGQSKTAFQAEVDATCELIDFWRFNVQFAGELYAEQPLPATGMTNQIDYRGLEGFVYAVSPFNFTAIGGLEARRLGNAFCVAHDAAAAGSGNAPGRHQLRARQRRHGVGSRTRAP